MEDGARNNVVHVISCKRQTQIEKEYLDQLPLAKERLAAYPILSRLFDNFSIYEDKSSYKSSENFVFRTCIRRPKRFCHIFNPVTLLQDSSNFPSLLDELEKAISHFNITECWSEKEKREFKSRLTSPDSHDSYVAVYELLIPYKIDQKIGPNKVTIRPKTLSGKIPDMLLQIGTNKRIFVELTSLEERKSEKTIEKITKDFAEYLNNKCAGKGYTIFVHYDTAILIPFKDNEVHIDVELAKGFLQKWADKLLLYELIGSEGRIEFDEDYTNQDASLLDIYRARGLISLPSELTKMIKEQALVQTWAKKVRINDYLRSPFKSVTYATGVNNECVVVDSIEVDSSDESLRKKEILHTASVVKDAFKEQLRRCILYKVERKQYIEGTPVVFGINAFEWRFMFEDDPDALIELGQVIQKEIMKFSWISGVIIYYSDFYNGKYIENRQAERMIRLTARELENLGVLRKSPTSTC